MSASADHRDDGRRTRGVALIAVLWISSLLALLAAGVGSSSRTDVRLTYNRVEQAEARALADAGVHQALYALMTAPDAQLWQADGIARELALGQGAVRFRVTDEDSKLDVNVASIELFRGLFGAVGLDADQARTLADRLGDFRDADSDPEPFGAEDDAYLAAGHTDGAADRPFLGIAELLDVIGMTDEIYRRIRPYVTVHADVEGVDPTRASPIVLQALPGMTPDLAQSIVAQPPESDPLLSIPADIATDIDAYLLPSRELMFSVESLGMSDGGGRFMREAIVALDGGTRVQPFTIYSWTRGRVPESEGETR